MNWIVELIQILFPKAAVQGTQWEAQWDDEQRTIFVRNASFFFPVAALIYVGHFIFYDLVADLQPIEYWFAFRMTAATICLAAFFYYRSRFTNLKFYKLPALVACILLCYSQARVTVHHEEVTYIFCFVFVFMAVLVLRSSPLNSFVYAALIIAVQFPSLMETDETLIMLISASAVTLLTCTAIRTSYASEIENFLLSRERDESNEKVIELTKDFSNRLKSFIPKVIADRLQNAVDLKGMSVLEASVEVLRPQTKNITCLFSDIRGFTQGSKNLDTFVGNSVIPEIKACSEAIEKNEGIPRKIGDLVFAYFDDEDQSSNTVRAIRAGLEISQLNKDLNDTSADEEIQRYILIASGEAIVGNIGGVDSSVEITALGSVVNFLARLDDATKHHALAECLEPGDIVLSASAAAEVALELPDTKLQRFDLEKAGIKIRDFPETTEVYIHRPMTVSLDRAS